MNPTDEAHLDDDPYGPGEADVLADNERLAAEIAQLRARVAELDDTRNWLHLANDRLGDLNTANADLRAENEELRARMAELGAGEVEYGVRTVIGRIVCVDSLAAAHRYVIAHTLAGEVVQRRPAGPWTPVEDEAEARDA